MDAGGVGGELIQRRQRQQQHNHQHQQPGPVQPLTELLNAKNANAPEGSVSNGPLRDDDSSGLVQGLAPACRSLSAPMELSVCCFGLVEGTDPSPAAVADDVMDEVEDEQQQQQPMEKCGLYCLARVDGDTGEPLRLATDREAEELGRILSLSGNGHLVTGASDVIRPGQAAKQQQQLMQQQGVQLQQRQQLGLGCGKATSIGSGRGSGGGGWRGGGPCDHCRATESPQWRRGPVGKPVLCNACGTRYRRTGQLGPPGPASSLRKTRSMSERKRYKVDDNEGRALLVYCPAA